jgi:hypothetical protein
MQCMVLHGRRGPLDESVDDPALPRLGWGGCTAVRVRKEPVRVSGLQR